MLFSEPKIPQYNPSGGVVVPPARFSALQRAENSSIVEATATGVIARVRFSALQRAENSSIVDNFVKLLYDGAFQCSSASRKFLNSAEATWIGSIEVKFQCSSASRKFLNKYKVFEITGEELVSVLFSEPKIPQFPTLFSRNCSSARVSVLFSEPKIPQSTASPSPVNTLVHGFSALQRAENSSIWARAARLN